MTRPCRAISVSASALVSRKGLVSRRGARGLGFLDKDYVGDVSEEIGKGVQEGGHDVGSVGLDKGSVSVLVCVLI